MKMDKNPNKKERKSNSRRSSILKRQDSCIISEGSEGSNGDGPRTPRRVSFASTTMVRMIPSTPLFSSGSGENSSTSDDASSTGHLMSSGSDDVFSMDSGPYVPEDPKLRVDMSLVHETISSGSEQIPASEEHAESHNRTILFSSLNQTGHDMDLTVNMSLLPDWDPHHQDENKVGPHLGRRQSFSDENELQEVDGFMKMTPANMQERYLPTNSGIDHAQGHLMTEVTKVFDTSLDAGIELTQNLVSMELPTGLNTVPVQSVIPRPKHTAVEDLLRAVTNGMAAPTPDKFFSEVEEDCDTKDKLEDMEMTNVDLPRSALLDITSHKILTPIAEMSTVSNVSSIDQESFRLGKGLSVKNANDMGQAVHDKLEQLSAKKYCKLDSVFIGKENISIGDQENLSVAHLNQINYMKQVSVVESKALHYSNSHAGKADVNNESFGDMEITECHTKTMCILEGNAEEDDDPEIQLKYTIGKYASENYLPSAGSNTENRARDLTAAFRTVSDSGSVGFYHEVPEATKLCADMEMTSVETKTIHFDVEPTSGKPGSHVKEHKTVDFVVKNQNKDKAGASQEENTQYIVGDMDTTQNVSILSAKCEQVQNRTLLEGDVDVVEHSQVVNNVENSERLKLPNTVYFDNSIGMEMTANITVPVVKENHAQKVDTYCGKSVMEKASNLSQNLVPDIEENSCVKAQIKMQHTNVSDVERNRSENVSKDLETSWKCPNENFEMKVGEDSAKPSQTTSSSIQDDNSKNEGEKLQHLGNKSHNLKVATQRSGSEMTELLTLSNSLVQVDFDQSQVNSIRMTGSQNTMTAEQEAIKKSLCKELSLPCSLSKRTSNAFEPFSAVRKRKSCNFDLILGTGARDVKLQRKTEAMNKSLDSGSLSEKEEESPSLEKESSLLTDQTKNLPTFFYNISSHSLDASCTSGMPHNRNSTLPEENISPIDPAASTMVSQSASESRMKQAVSSPNKSSEFNVSEDVYEWTDTLMNQEMPAAMPLIESFENAEEEFVVSSLNSLIEQPKSSQTKEKEITFDEICRTFGLCTNSSTPDKNIKLENVDTRSEAGKLEAKLIVVPKVQCLREHIEELEAVLERAKQDCKERLRHFSFKPPTSYSRYVQALEDKKDVSEARSKVQEVAKACSVSARAKWKRWKADYLMKYSSVREKSHQKLRSHMKEITASTQGVLNVSSQLDNCLEELEMLQTHSSDLFRLQEELTETERQTQGLQASCRESDAKAHAVKQKIFDSQNRISDQEIHVEQLKERLSWSNSLTEWSLIKERSNQLQFGFLYGTVMLQVDTVDSSKPNRRLTDITITSRLADQSKPWAKLAHQLAMESLEGMKLLQKYPSYQGLDQLLSEVSVIISSCRLLSADLRLTHLKHVMAVDGKSVVITVSSRETLRKVQVEASIPVKTYAKTPLTWKVKTLLGSPIEGLAKELEKVAAGAEYIFRCAQAVENLLLQ